MKDFTKVLCSIWVLLGLSLTAHLQAQVQGNAFLAGQATHDSISVIFSNTSTSGASDTAFTQSNGSYSINLGAGVYDIRMEAAGYQTVFFNQNQPVLLSGNDVLDSVTLQPGPTKYISGAVSGTFFSDTIYIANGDLSIAATASLFVEAGTEVRFEPNYTFTVDGQLSALGNQAEPIIFTLQSIGPGPQQWGGFKFTTLATTSTLQHCVVEYAKTLVDVNTTTFLIPLSPTPRLIIENSMFRHAEDAAMTLYSDQPIRVAHCELYDFGTLGISFAARNKTSPRHYTFLCNKIHGGDNYGIFTFLTAPDAFISGNEVYDMPNGIGIRVGRRDGGNVSVQNNLIYNVGQGIAESAQNCPQPAIIQNNVVFNCGLGINMIGEGGAVVQMNAVFQNNIGINQFDPNYGTPAELSYNLISQNVENYSSQVNVPFVGVPITVNTNGDSTDAYFNLDADPQLDSVSFLPLFTSTLINAGDPAFVNQNGSVRDIGLFLDSLACWMPQAVPVSTVYPGDANNDQVANAWDVFSIGIAFGQTGPARPNASLAWSPQAAPEWGKNLPSGLDLSHVDTDGNGIIQAADMTAISTNYSLAFQSPMQIVSGGLPFYVDVPTSFTPGDTLYLPIMLGTADSVVSNVYGLAFSLSYDNSLIKPNSVQLTVDGSWMGTDGQDLLTLTHSDFANSVVEVGMVRNDSTSVSGYGQIATLMMVLDENLPDGAFDFTLSWQAVDAIHQDESPLALSPRNVSASFTTSTDDLLTQRGIRYFPNPARERLQLSRGHLGQAAQIRLMDTGGKIYLSREMGSHQSEISFSVREIPAGLYVLQFLEEDAAPVYMKVLIE
ncbi:MAG: right-handed parallel beta-helix repeat-containing protein [Bacteroidota bacterium]